MIKSGHSILIMLALCLGTFVHAQDTSGLIRLANGNFNTGNNISRKTFSINDLVSSVYGNRYYVLIRFSSLPSVQNIKDLSAAGIQLGEYIPGNSYFSSIHTGFDFLSASQYGIVSVNPLPAGYKLHPSLFNYEPAKVKKENSWFAISISASVNKYEAEQLLQSMGIVVIPSKFNFKNTILIQPDIGKLNAIAALPFVSFVQQQMISDKVMNYNDIAIHNMSSLQSPAGRNLSGRDVVVGVGDNADISTHIDFTGKNIARVPYPWDYHGTHTSGTVAGAGFLNPKNQGMAPRTHIVSQWFSDVILFTPEYITDYNLVATNNSYYSTAIGCSGNRVYDVLSHFIDAQMKDHDEVLHVIAAGNDGTSTCAGYPTSYGTVKSGWQSAKNVITVGAMDQANYAIASFSSRGPMQDGRIKPEIVTNGYATRSTYPFDTYQLNYGTSMAAPVITGVTALLQENYRKLHAGANAKAALLKALMCNTAEDLGNPGPDYTYGFGMLNAGKAAEAMEANRYFSGNLVTSQTTNVNITVPAGARRLKVMLVWADHPATANASSTLVNDIDLTVTEPSLAVHLPLVLDPVNVGNIAVEAADHVNNIEQVVISNPVAGTYNITVNGFAIPQGPQPYFITYQVDMNGVHVDYPSGGETLVPGETETIRWTAYGDENNTFNIEYTDNNGSTWNAAGAGSNNVASSARSFSFTVPATVSDLYKVRVSRNASAFTGVSEPTFTVMGQPFVTATVLCEGYVQLDWAAVSSATSYDIFQQDADSMKLVGNTTGNSFLLAGLQISKTYLFAVRARNAAIAGRRSLGVKIVPSGGTCSLPAFNNNFKAVSIDAPVTGRQFTSISLTASETVKLKVKNLDNSLSSGSYDLSYQVNGGPVITETANVNIAALGNYTHTFASTAAFALPGMYQVKSWVKKVGDIYPLDDTVQLTIKHLANPVLVLPVSEGFESTSAREYTSNTIGLEGSDRTDFKTASSRGRARTFVNTGFALSGNRAITLDQSSYGVLGTDSLLMTWNLSNYSSGKQLRIDFNYRNHGQAPNPDNKVWIRGSDNQPWILAYDLLANQAELGQWKLGLINVNDIMDTAVVPQTVGASFQVKIAQQGNTSANAPDPILDQDDGYTIDDVIISEAIGDVSVADILSPKRDGCGLTASHPVTLRIKNYNNIAVNNIVVNYRINGGALVTENIPVLQASQVLDFTFSATANLAAYTDYTLDYWLTAPGDNYRSNDSILNYSIHNSPVISTYPYLEGFESGNGNWYAKGTNTSWEWGTPANNIISKAANGSNAWVTKLSGNYNDNELSYLYSPCFDLTGLVQPVLSFSHIFEIEQDYDYTWVEYSTDGRVWKKLGAAGNGTNWYDNAVSDNWRLSKMQWHVASIEIPPFAGNMRFRFVFSSDGGVNMEGVGIDDIHVFDRAAIYTGGPVTGISQPVSGTDWIHFYSAGKIVASINPQGRNLGVTNVDVYPYSGPARFSNNEYYLDRNIVVRPSIVPDRNVTLRVYFTDAEATSLVNASGCAACGNMTDPYELGVTKYSGSMDDENGMLEDDLTGYFRFILPANTEIIPYDNGYYAEFVISSFSECWLSRADIKPPSTNTCPGATISITANLQGTTYQWQEDNGSGYTNIVNGANYAGADTETLQLINLPTSYTGYKYRCVVDAVNGNESTIRFMAIWNGTVSTDWMNAGNWHCGLVPDQYTDVIIPGNVSIKPELNASTSVRSVRVYPNMQVLIKAGINLQILGE